MDIVEEGVVFDPVCLPVSTYSKRENGGEFSRLMEHEGRLKKKHAISAATMPPRTYQCVLLLMCAVACVSVCEAVVVNATQRLIMDDLVRDWPVLARLKEGAWTAQGMDQACNRSRIAAYGVRCDDTGWISALDWSNLREKMQNDSEVLGLCSDAVSRFSLLKVLIFKNSGLRGQLPSSWSNLAYLQTLIIEDEPLLGNSTFIPSNETRKASHQNPQDSIIEFQASSTSTSTTLPTDSTANHLRIMTTADKPSGDHVEGRKQLPPNLADDFQPSTSSSSTTLKSDSSSNVAASPKRSLTASAAPLAAGIPSSWSKLHNLVTLRLVNLSSFECQLPGYIYNSWPLLKSIQIVGTPCFGLLTNSLFWAPLQLKNVSLSNNRFSGSLPSILAGANMTFETLDLSWNFFTGTVPNVWERSPPRRLSLSGNLFSGFLPSRIGPSIEVSSNGSSTNSTSKTLKSAKLVDFSRNMLTGTIPQSLLDSYVVELILDNNDLVGNLTLPKIGRNLKKLSVKENRLSGPLPLSLWNASRLEYLDASSNFLTGPFPDTPDDVDDTDEPGDDDDPDPNEDNSIFTTVFSKLTQGVSDFFGRTEDEKSEPKVVNVEASSFLNINPATSWTIPEMCYLTHIILSHNPLNARLPESLGSCSLTLVRIEMANASLVGTVNEKFVDVNLELFITWSPLMSPNDTFTLDDLPFSPLRTVDLSYNNLVGPLPYFFEDIDETAMHPRGNLELRVQENRFDSALPGKYFNKSSYFQYFNISHNRLKICEERGSTYKLRFAVCDASAQFPSSCGCPALWYPDCLPFEMRPKCITAAEKVTHSTILGAVMLIAFTYLALKELTWMQI